jgi:hypothetical protein
VLKSKIIITIAVVALAITLATTIVAQMVVARSDDSPPSRDQLSRNCQNGNAYACGRLNGNPANVNPDTGVITQCQQIPNETPLCTGVNVK